MISNEASATQTKRRINWPRIFGYDFFISFKLGLPPVGAQSYASDLARRLRELDFTVFFSEEEAPPGEKLDLTLINALHLSRVLIVIANESALLHSQWIRREVEEFRSRHPKRPIIIINVDHAIEKHCVQSNAAGWLDHVGKIWLDEPGRAIEEGIVSPGVVKRLEITHHFIRSNTRFRWTVSAIVLMLIGLASWASVEAWDANRKFRNATALRLLVESGALTAGLRSSGTNEGLLKVLAGHRLFRSINTEETLRSEYQKFSQLIYLRNNNTSVNSVAFSPDGRRIVSGSGDSTVRLWPVFEGWGDALCKKIGRNMSYHEWREWVSPDIDYLEQCPDLPIPQDESDNKN